MVSCRVWVLKLGDSIHQRLPVALGDLMHVIDANIRFRHLKLAQCRIGTSIAIFHVGRNVILVLIDRARFGLVWARWNCLSVDPDELCE